MRKKKLAYLAMTAAAILSTGVSARDVINVGMNADIASTEYATKHDDNTMMVLHHVMEGLVAYGEDMTVRPLLAEKVEVSQDGRTYTFTLRDGVTFHNGEAVTPEMVEWNFKRFMQEERDWGSHCREQLDGSFEEYIRPAYVIDTRVSGDREFEVTLQSPSAMFLHHLASNHCIYGIVHPDSLNADGSWNRPIATGPYSLGEWHRNEHVILRRFDGYRAAQGPRDGLVGGRQPIADELHFSVVKDEAEALAMLSRGALDLLVNVDPDHMDMAQANAELNPVVNETPAFLQLIPQTRTDDLLSNPRMRKAIAHAIDTDRLVNVALNNLVEPNQSVVATSSPYYTDAHRARHGYDLDEAKRLLEEVGYASEPVSILTSRDPYPIFGRAADAAAIMLQEAGINAFVEDVDWGTHDKRYGANEYQLTTIAFSTRTDPTLMYSALIGQKGDHSWYLWEDQQAEMWNTISAVQEEPALRQEMFDNLHGKMLEWVPTIGLANYPRLDIARDELVGYEGWSLAIPRLWGVDK